MAGSVDIGMFAEADPEEQSNDVRPPLAYIMSPVLIRC